MEETYICPAGEGLKTRDHRNYLRNLRVVVNTKPIKQWRNLWLGITFVKRNGWETCNILRWGLPLALSHKDYFYCVISVIWFVFHSVVYFFNPKGGATAFGYGYTVPYFPNKRFSGFTCPASAHVGRYLMFLLSTLLLQALSQFKRILGLADNAHASTSECVRPCGEDKITEV